MEALLRGLVEVVEVAISHQQQALLVSCVGTPSLLQRWGMHSSRYLFSKVGWKAKTTLQEGLVKTYQDFLNNNALRLG